jgi:transposase
VINCVSTGNDLAEKGYCFHKTHEPQINLLMAYDVNTGIPLFSRMYEGANHDKTSLKDLMIHVELKDMLFLVDRGFYSSENLALFSSNGNSYIIPLTKNLTICKTAVSNLELKDRFLYQKGRKSSVIEYRDQTILGERVLVFRDLNESALEQENYLRHKDRGEASYTDAGFLEAKDFMGVSVLQTNLTKESAQEVYALFKKRWQIETYFNYFKNTAGYHALYQNDYYKTQGLSFIMLVNALVYRDFEKAVSKVKGKSIPDCLLDARFVKINLRRGKWFTTNCKKGLQMLFTKLNTDMVVKLN